MRLHPAVLFALLLTGTQPAAAQITYGLTQVHLQNLYVHNGNQLYLDTYNGNHLGGNGVESGPSPTRDGLSGTWTFFAASGSLDPPATGGLVNVHDRVYIRSLFAGGHWLRNWGASQQHGGLELETVDTLSTSVFHRASEESQEPPV